VVCAFAVTDASAIKIKINNTDDFILLIASSDKEPLLSNSV
jgi:hypothetical protein